MKSGRCVLHRIGGLPLFLLLLPFPCLPDFAYATTEYYRHNIFDNSLTPDFYFYSWAQASGTSFVNQKNWRLPVDGKTFFTPPNALRLEWQSQAGGGWEAEVRVINFRYRFPGFAGSNLYIWCFAPQAIAADDLPRVMLSTTREGLQVAEFPPASFSDPVPLGKFAADLPPGRWVRIRIPVSEFHTASIYDFQPKYVQDVVFLQGKADGLRHTLLLDEIAIDDAAGDKEASLPAPQNVAAAGYDRPSKCAGTR
jgi:exo beta-1,2-glucooligosaccharide sophorohydrolase (non-reducing end)